MKKQGMWMVVIVLAAVLLSQSGCVILDRLTGDGDAGSVEVDPGDAGQGNGPSGNAPGPDGEQPLQNQEELGEGDQQSPANQPGNQNAPPNNQNNPPAQNSGCTNGFELDGTPLLSSGAQFDTGELFEAGWTLLNTGTCTWDSGYELVMIGGDDMGASSAQLQADVAPGDSTTVTVELQAPSQTGAYLAVWKLEDGSGYRFGMDSPANAPLRVKIEVVSNGSSDAPELEPHLDLSSFPNVYTNGADQTMTGNQCYDLEDGDVVSCSDSSADFRYNYAVGQGGTLTGLNGTRFSSTFGSVPSEEDLAAASFYSDPAPLPESGPTGRYYGFTTEVDGDTAYGWMLPTAYNQGGLTFTYLVFEPDSVPAITEAEPELNLNMFVLVSEEQETVLVDRCYDLEDGTKASCSDSEADIMYTFHGGTGTLEFLNGAEQNIGDYADQPDKATCQADAYMTGFNYIHETPADYNCFTTTVDGDFVYGWYRVTAYNSGGMTFDYTIWTP